MAQETSADIATHAASPKSDLLAPEIMMMLLTWFLFFALLAILKKYAWKPILKTLDERESSIRKSVDEAEKIRTEYQQIGDKRKQVLLEADTQAKEIMSQSRQAAIKSAKLIEERAKNETQIMIENAKREIEAEENKAASSLRVKSADTAVALAERILRENLDGDKQKKIINTLIDEI